MKMRVSRFDTSSSQFVTKVQDYALAIQVSESVRMGGYGDEVCRTCLEFLMGLKTGPS
jgi:hypothetical protein